MTGKYEPLRLHLTALASGDQPTVECTFAEIAALVDGLPASAYKWSAWWANNGHPHADAWHSAGWRVDHANLDRQRVRFARSAVGGGSLS